MPSEPETPVYTPTLDVASAYVPEDYVVPDYVPELEYGSEDGYGSDTASDTAAPL